MIYKYFLIFSFLYVVGQTDQKICNQLKPCGERGVCGRSSDETTKDILTIKCFCRSNYTGQWCQFVDDKYKPGAKDKIPGKPKIITDTKLPNYDKKYYLKFEGVKDPPGGKVLYYLLRYTDVTTPQGEWRSQALPVKNKGGIHQVVLDKLDWGRKYKMELYAGNKYGLGQPGQRILKRPKVSEPKIVEVSKDLTGRNAVCCGKPLTLHCKAKGGPQPTYTWHYNGMTLPATSAIVMKHGTLTISKPLSNIHQGEYRCLASNVWGSVLSRPIQVKILAPGRSVKKVGNVKITSFSRIRLPHQTLYQETNLTLTCGKRKEAIHTTWFYNGNILKSPGLNKNDIGQVSINGRRVDIHYKLDDGRLQLVHTKPISSGIYQCDVRTKDGLVSMTQYVYVRDFDHIEPLSIKHKTSNEVRLKKGSTATLTCLPTASDTLPIIWKNLPRKTEKRSRKLPNGSLEIRDVRQSESNMRITCESSSDQGVSAKRSIRVHVARSVNGGWSSWGSWQPCRDKKCVRDIRVRKCNNPVPRYDGKYCPGSETEESGDWSGWSAWVCKPISGKCGKHVKVRTRKCQGFCPGKAKETKSCSLYIPCPVNGSWSQWSSWSACTKSCYPGGTKSRVRKCKPPKHGGKTCKGRSKMSKKCRTTRPCPIPGGWSSWSSWSQCSTTCNTGIQSRDRSCTKPAPKHGGKKCQGTNTGRKECMIGLCKVDGGWSAWSDFSACSVSCGAGVKYSTRICNNPRTAHGGKECEGNSQYRTQCDMAPCKVNGGWSMWSEWTACSTTCNAGVTSRIRICSNPEPKYGGQDCQGENKNKKTCNMRPCPVNGGWAVWSEWSSCSATCDSGVRTRIRTCTHPKPRHGGKKCDGKHEFQAKCNQKSCKGIKDEGLPDVELAKKNSGSSNNNTNAMMYTFVGGIGGLALLGILFCCYRTWYMRTHNKGYMPLTTVKTQPIEPKSILKSTPTRRASTALDSSELPSNKRSSITSDTSDTLSGKRGSLPPPVPETPRPTRGKRRSGKKTKQSTDSKKENTKDGTDRLDKIPLKRGKATLRSEKAKDKSAHKTAKDSGLPNDPSGPPMSSSTPQGSTSSDDDTLEKAVLESGEVKDGEVRKMTSPRVTERSQIGDKTGLGKVEDNKNKMTPPSVTERSQIGDKTGLVKVGDNKDKITSPSVTERSQIGDKTGLVKVGDNKDNNGKNIVKQDSSALFVPKRPSMPPTFPSDPSGEFSKPRSESIYEGLIEFENAILETGDDKVSVKKAMIQKIKSKSKPK